MNAVSTAYYQPLVGAQSEKVVNPAKQKIGETTGEAPDNASNWARKYYESVNKVRIALDLSQYAQINEKRMQTNYEATNILSAASIPPKITRRLSTPFFQAGVMTNFIMAKSRLFKIRILALALIMIFANQIYLKPPCIMKSR
ncbi:MAG: hypothetical protein LBF86_03020 [Helicobacteraceae bacterium]|jgi:hypothetical protein|nr:hypothetical protein [Helicobacteraceae bacterium]